jgi:VanZ family protein
MKYIFWRFIFFVTAIAVLFLAIVPNSTPLPTTGWDKSNHLIAFAALAYLGQKAFSQNSFKLIIGLIAFGGLIEMLQTFTPTRSGEWQDLITDVIGIFIGLFLAMRL